MDWPGKNRGESADSCLRASRTSEHSHSGLPCPSPRACGFKQPELEVLRLSLEPRRTRDCHWYLGPSHLLGLSRGLRHGDHVKN